MWAKNQREVKLIQSWLQYSSILFPGVFSKIFAAQGCWRSSIYLLLTWAMLKFQYLKDSFLVPMTNVGYFHLKGKDSGCLYEKKSINKSVFSLLFSAYVDRGHNMLSTCSVLWDQSLLNLSASHFLILIINITHLLALVFIMKFLFSDLKHEELNFVQGIMSSGRTALAC